MPHRRQRIGGSSPMALLFCQSLAERICAESLARIHEPEAAPAALRQRALERAESAGDTESKLLAYYLALPEAGPARRQLARDRQSLRWILAGLALAALLAGAATGLTSLTGARAAPINILWCLAGLLGLHTLTLLAWLSVMLWAPNRPARWSLGAGALWLWRRVAAYFGGRGLAAATRGALLRRLSAPPAGRWIASGLSHGLWLAFLLGAIAMSLAVLSSRHVVFVWESTILAAETYEALLGGLAAGAELLGFPIPDGGAIAAAQSRGGAPPIEQDGRVWSGFLLGSLAVYGVLPRLAGLALCLWRARRALRARGLDLADPAFSRLIPDLAPVLRRTQVVRSAQSDEARAPADRPADGEALSGADPPAPPPGPVAVLGWEIEPPETGWPPPLRGAALCDLGLCDDRPGLRTGLASPQAASAVRIVLVAELTRTPDRGVAAGLGEAGESAGERLFLLLTRWQACRDRLGEEAARQRLADWVSAAHAAGLALDRIVALDLDDRNAGERRRLTGVLGGGDAG